jgi:hypothetical protein
VILRSGGCAETLLVADWILKMKKTYLKPTLAKQQTLAAITAAPDSGNVT